MKLKSVYHVYDNGVSEGVFESIPSNLSPSHTVMEVYEKLEFVSAEDLPVFKPQSTGIVGCMKYDDLMGTFEPVANPTNVPEDTIICYAMKILHTEMVTTHQPTPVENATIDIAPDFGVYESVESEENNCGEVEQDTFANWMRCVCVYVLRTTHNMSVIEISKNIKLSRTPIYGHINYMKRVLNDTTGRIFLNGNDMINYYERALSFSKEELIKICKKQ